jgi:hypothetical protein
MSAALDTAISSSRANYFVRQRNRTYFPYFGPFYAPALAARNESDRTSACGKLRPHVPSKLCERQFVKKLSRPFCSLTPRPQEEPFV